MRPDLAQPPVSPAAKQAMEALQSDLVAEIRTLVAGHPVVVVGMGWNPHVRAIRAALDEAKIEHQYREIGNYASKWRERLAIKMWTGWPTFPQVFVRGTFVGGRDLTTAMLKDGTLRAMLDA